MECSALNAHFYGKNIVPCPSCICGGFESPYHFLFVCPKYTVARNMYLPNNLTDYTTHDLLFGKESEPVSENETLFLQVQDFIIKNQVGSWIPLDERFCPSPKIRHHLHLFIIITFTFTRGYLSLGSG